MLRIWAEKKRGKRGQYGLTGNFEIAVDPLENKDREYLHEHNIRYSSIAELPFEIPDNYIDKELGRDKILSFFDDLYKQEKNQEAKKKIEEAKRTFKKTTITLQLPKKGVCLYSPLSSEFFVI